MVSRSVSMPSLLPWPTASCHTYISAEEKFVYAAVLGKKSMH